MSLLFALAQTAGALAKWTAMLIALALAVVNPAPKHAAQQHHQPIRLPELATAATANP